MNVTGETPALASRDKVPGRARGTSEAKEAARCRTNSRRGLTDPARRSYQPVESVCRALDVLKAVNKLRIASINGIFEATSIPKPTIVRMLETLMAQGYVARDNMCGGYRVTCRVRDLDSGYDGISRVIEVARPLAIDLTRRIKWPIGIGSIDGDAIAIHFWTGAISPWAHTKTVLGLRPNLHTTAMGRAYLAYCPEAERERHLERLRRDPERSFDEAEERRFRLLLEQVRADGYSSRDPRTKPYRTTTLAMPIREGEQVHALVSISFFTTAVPTGQIADQVVAPLRCTINKIEQAFAFMNGAGLGHEHVAAEGLELGF